MKMTFKRGSQNFFSLSLFEVLQIGISLLTLFIAYNVYRAFDVPQNLKERQLEKVLMLVDLMNQNTIIIDLVTDSSGCYLAEDKCLRISTSFVGIPSHGIVLNGELIHPEGVYFEENYQFVFSWMRMYSDPMLPKSIAQKLRKIYVDEAIKSKYDYSHSTFIALSRKSYPCINVSQKYRLDSSPMTVSPDFCVQSSNPYLRTYDSLIIARNEVVSSVLDWLTEHDITDINLSTQSTSMSYDDDFYILRDTNTSGDSIPVF
ncbi:MAG: hypothetical protein IPM49_00580 [Flavobacteriales bacterium]|nr:hypothetical protein [Flavobacteriales bacterium]